MTSDIKVGDWVSGEKDLDSGIIRFPFGNMPPGVSMKFPFDGTVDSIGVSGDILTVVNKGSCFMVNKKHIKNVVHQK